MKSSYLPCPNWWSLSAGFDDSDTEKNAITDASKSELEWIASDRIPILPEIKPATNLSIISEVFDIIDNFATLFFFFSFKMSVKMPFYSEKSKIEPCFSFFTFA